MRCLEWNDIKQDENFKKMFWKFENLIMTSGYGYHAGKNSKYTWPLEKSYNQKASAEAQQRWLDALQ